MKDNFQQILSFTLYRAVFCDLLPEKFCLKIPKESSKAVTRRKTDKKTNIWRANITQKTND